MPAPALVLLGGGAAGADVSAPPAQQLDDTRVHPQNYKHTFEIAKSAIDQPDEGAPRPPAPRPCTRRRDAARADSACAPQLPSPCSTLQLPALPCLRVSPENRDKGDFQDHVICVPYRIHTW